MNTKKGINLNFFFILLSTITFTALSLKVSAKTSVVVTSENTRNSELDAYLKLGTDKISFSELIRSQDGSLDEDLLGKLQPSNDNRSDFKKIAIEQIAQDPQFSLLLKGFLSPLRKKLFIEMIKTEVVDSSKKVDLIASLSEVKNVKSGTFELPTKLIHDTDQLYINGDLIKPEELSSLRLNTDTLYHFSLISNNSLPVYLWSKPKDFVPGSRKYLAQGTCDKPIFNFEMPMENLEVLYPNNCSIYHPNASMPLSLQNELNVNKSTWWDRNKAWAIGGSLFIIGTGIYEASRKYEIKIGLPF